MTYLKDTMTDAVRCFDEQIPKEARKIKMFLRAKAYEYDSETNTIDTSRGRWRMGTKKDYDAWIKASTVIDVRSKEV